MRGFLDVASTLLVRKRAGKRAKNFASIFDALALLQQVHSKSEFDLINLESVFTALELSKTLGRFPGLSADLIDERIQDLKWVIVHTLQETLEFIRQPQGFGSDGLKRLIETIDKARQEDPTNDTAILTFNYDLLLEVAIHFAGCSVDYGLAKESTDYPSIPLLKLHGSLNWAVERGTGKIVPWFLRQYFRQAKLNDGGNPPGNIRLRVADHFETFSKSSKTDYEETPLIVPPSWNKAAAYSSISEVWKRAANELSTASSIFVVGYSLPETDSFFRQLYALGTVGQTLLRRFWVFNLDDSRDTVFRSMLGPGARDRFKFFREDFETAQSRIAEAINER